MKIAYLNNGRIKYALASAAAPLTYTLCFLLLFVSWRILKLPNPAEMFSLIVRLFEHYGLWVVGISALIEGLVLITLYFPGSGVILLGMVACKGDPTRAVKLVLIVDLAFLASSQINYLLGYYGLHGLVQRLGGRKWLEQANHRYSRFGAYIVPVSFIHPTFGGFISVACGTARMKWQTFTFLAFTSIFLWNIFWGLLAYHLADTVREVATRPALVIIGLSAWAIAAFLYGLTKKQGVTGSLNSN